VAFQGAGRKGEGKERRKGRGKGGGRSHVSVMTGPLLFGKVHDVHVPSAAGEKENESEKKKKKKGSRGPRRGLQPVYACFGPVGGDQL